MPKAKSILLTGSVGFIGNHMLHYLLGRGHAVRPTDKKFDPKMWSGAVWYDLQDLGRAEELFEANDFHAVIHLAANSSLQKSIADPVYDVKNNIIPMLNLIHLCRKYEVKRIVFSSTSAVYAKDAKPPYAEGAKIAPMSPYGISKLACEFYLAASGVPCSILRYGNVYGPGQRAVGENALVARALNHIVHGEPFTINGDGEQVRDWIYIDDVCRANELAMADGPSYVCNISTGVGVSVNAVVSILCKARNYDYGLIKHGPAKPGELREVVLDPRRAQSVMGWTAQVPWSTGLNKTAEAWA